MPGGEQDSTTPAQPDNAGPKGAEQDEGVVDHAAFAARMKAQVASRHQPQSSPPVRPARPCPRTCFQRLPGRVHQGCSVQNTTTPKDFFF